ncbi:uncharacterized protein [Typha angustifolia]|uniref:uncharacterized protein n=1 Tax=Typha angustifolia TaxID=59011 RepID=UPI003C30E948
MKFGVCDEAKLLMDDGLVSPPPPPPPSSSSSIICQCRICHEEEGEESTSMESPCACSGTLKFAHRECIQRWCDEKGSTLCEICLQNFEPNYTVPPKKAQLIDVAVTIRGSLQVPRLNYEPQNRGPNETATDDALELHYAVCSPAAERRASWCRTIAAMFTAMLLVRHLIAVLTVGADHYAFTLLTVFLLRASGILLPFYFVLRMMSAIQHAQRQYQLEQLQRRDDSSIHEVEEDEELHQHTIQIHS